MKKTCSPTHFNSFDEKINEYKQYFKEKINCIECIKLLVEKVSHMKESFGDNLEEFKNVMFCGDDVLIGDEKGTPAVRKFETYGDAIGKVNEIVFKFEEATHLNKENKIGQLHLQQANHLYFSNYPKLEKWIKEKILILFKTKLPQNADVNLLNLSEILPTLYSKGCELKTHEDGRRDDEKNWSFVKFANILIYLNKIIFNDN